MSDDLYEIDTPMLNDGSSTIQENTKVVKPKQNSYIHFRCTYPKQDGDVIISLPTNNNAVIEEAFKNILDKQILDNDESRKWAEIVKDSINNATFKSAFVSTLEDNNSKFEQFIEANGTQLMGRAPRTKNVENDNLKGNRAVMRVLEKLKLGSLYQTPLWNTGIWITFRPPTETAIVELNRQIAADTVELGRSSYGLIFSNTAVYTVNRLIEFALSHIQDTTLKIDLSDINAIKKVISAQDIPTILWGLACALHPNGFNYRRACTTNPDKCHHIEEGLIHLAKLLWVNRNGLTDWQRIHMSNRTPNSKTIEEIDRYKSELKVGEKRSYELVEGFNVILKTPSIVEYIDAGYQWIESIVTLTEEAAGSGLSAEEKNSHIIRHGQATSLRQYVHWVSELNLDSNVIDDKETLYTTFDALSSDETINNKFMEHIADYINKSTISIIGIPEYNCTNCGEIQEGNKSIPEHSNIVPLDVTQLFFTLITERMRKIVKR
jgi:hypothetical protein